MSSGLESDERPPERYRRLVIEYELARRARLAAGLTLSPAEEAAFIDGLDQAWWAMSDAEQDDYEREIGRTIAKVWRKGRVVRLPPAPRRAAEPWLLGELAAPRWVVLLAWTLHVLLMFALGRLSHGCP